MSLRTKIPATVVTGFLGAGKTSLIRHLLAHADGRRIALIINEFGEIGFDREILLSCNDGLCAAEDIVELANGCICCTVADDFLPTMEKLLTRAPPPDHIVIETSGLALPKPLVKAFAWPEVADRVTVDGVIAVVDAAALADECFAAPEFWALAQAKGAPPPKHDLPLAEVFGDQLACADLVILNKTDLLKPMRLQSALRSASAGVRPGVKVIEAVHGRVNPGVVLGLTAAAETDFDSRPSHHDALASHDHDDFESFIVPLAMVAERARFERALRIAGAQSRVLRIKGFAAVEGKDMRLAIQGVGPRLATYFDRPWRAGESRDGAVVVIGEKGVAQDVILQIVADGAARLAVAEV
jgi:cobalamin biosynthesis protein CobW